MNGELRAPTVDSFQDLAFGLGAFKHGAFEQVDDLSADRAILLLCLATDLLIKIFGDIANVKNRRMKHLIRKTLGSSGGCYY